MKAARSKILLACAFAAILSGLCYAFWIEPSRLKTEYIEIKSARLTPGFSLKIVQLSDLHLHGFGAFHQRILDAVAAIRPDLIAITGDFLSSGGVYADSGALRRNIAAAGKLASRLRAPQGIWAVRGNNDVTIAKEVSNELYYQLQAAGIHVLANESARLDIQGNALYLMGVDYSEFSERQAAEFYVAEMKAGNRVMASHSSGRDSYSHYYRRDAGSWHDYLYTGKLMISSREGAVGLTFYSQMDRGLDRFYCLQRNSAQSGFHFSAHAASVSGAPDTGLVPEPDVWYTFKIQVDTGPDRTAMKAKIWPSGQNEPARWMAEAYDDSARRIAGGTVGVWSHRNGTHFFDDLAVLADNGDAQSTLLHESFDSCAAGSDPPGWIDYGTKIEAVPIIAGFLPKDGFKLLLSHSPDLIPLAARQEIDLVLSGHTHGGQMCLPFLGALYTGTNLGPKYASGLFRFQNTWLYVNRGIGTISTPARTFCPPEITVITLKGR
jgi:predicted MPP superfamily phosphohydrolase